MTYRDAINATADGAEAQVLAARAAWQAGTLTSDAFLVLVAAFVSAANSTTAAIADLSLAAAITTKTGRVVAPLGLTTPTDDPDRLTKAASSLVALDDATPERWGRLARSEPLETAARAYSTGVRRSRHVTGWTRGLSANACRLCTWWSRDGRVWPDDHPMPTHKGCTCNPEPITR